MKRIICITIILILLIQMMSCSDFSSIYIRSDLIGLMNEEDCNSLYEEFADVYKEFSGFDKDLESFFELLKSYNLNYDNASVNYESGGGEEKYRAGRCIYYSCGPDIQGVVDSAGNQYIISFYYINIDADNSDREGIDGIWLRRCIPDSYRTEVCLYIGKIGNGILYEEHSGDEGFYFYEIIE